MFAIGDVVVLGGYLKGRFHPTIHNTTPESVNELGGSGSRGRVLKVGTKITYVSTIGAPIRVGAKGSSYWVALPVEEAKRKYRATLEYYAARGGSNTPERINQLVAEL